MAKYIFLPQHFDKQIDRQTDRQAVLASSELGQPQFSKNSGKLVVAATLLPQTVSLVVVVGSVGIG